MHFGWMRRQLRRWFDRNQRALLWRREPREPYIVLVAETMLQQTQVERVEAILPRFLERFPTLDALAGASRAEVIAAWQGLGYNRRAVHLHRCAQAIVSDHRGIVPDDYALLRRLPGIGDYTARAIAAFAYKRDVAVVDVNVRRVLSRFFAVQPTETDLLPLPTVREIAESVLPPGGGRWWNEALMDIGSLYCRRRAPKCTDCPLAHRCASAGRMAPSASPPKREPTYCGVPRRLWRGRLVELLRRHSMISVASCAQLLFGSASRRHVAWLERVVAQLQREGVIVSTADGRLDLPK